MVTLELPNPAILDKLSYVLSSGQREKVLASLFPGPKTSAQIAEETTLRLPHVSRAVAELTRNGLVQLLTQERRGKLYGLTDDGRAVFEEIRKSRGDRVVAPMIRGSHFKVYHHWVSVNHGREAADHLFRQFGIEPRKIDVQGWYPLRTTVQVLESIEALFGDGSYETIRQLFHDEVGNFSSLRRLAARLLPMSLLIELGPGVYAREFNHGRFEVEVRGHRAIIRNYDWINSPARCAAWLGTYEGMLELTGNRGKVHKVACMLNGDAYCGYEMEW